MSASAYYSAVMPEGLLESVDIPSPLMARLSPSPRGLATGKGGGKPWSLSESDAPFLSADGSCFFCFSSKYSSSSAIYSAVFPFSP